MLGWKVIDADQEDVGGQGAVGALGLLPTQMYFLELPEHLPSA